MIMEAFDTKFCKQSSGWETPELMKLKTEVRHVLTQPDEISKDKRKGDHSVDVPFFPIDWEKPVVPPPIVRNDIEFDPKKYGLE